jgi:hypothetical protein
MVKLPKFVAWKQSDPDRPGLLLHPRYSSRDYVGIHRILAELPHSSKLEPWNPIGPQRILIELLHSSYEEGSRHEKGKAGGLPGLSRVLGVARARKLCRNLLGFNSQRILRVLIEDRLLSPSGVLESRLVRIILRHYLGMGDLPIILSHSFASFLLFVHLHTV